MGIKCAILSLSFILCSGVITTTSAQRDTNVTYSWNGRIIRYYKVEKGKTLYGISKQFNIPQDTLIAVNPELKDGVKTGKVLRIPVGFLKNESAPAQATATEHIVQPKETVFGISSKYGLTIEELTKLNPEIDKGLQPGMRLVLVDKSGKKADHTPAKKSDSSKEPLKESPKDGLQIGNEDESDKTKKRNSCKPRAKSDGHDVINVALLLPFYINESGEFNPKSKIGLDFYSGAMLALDSLEKRGLRIKVSVFDTQNDSASIKELLDKPDFKKTDLIIGPLYSLAFRVAAQYAQKHGIVAVSPFSQSSAILENYPVVCKVTPDATVLAEQTCLFLAKQKQNARFILIKNSNVKDEELISTYRRILSDSSLHSKSRFKEVSYSGITDVINSLDESTENYIFFPSTVQVQVIDFISRVSNNRSGKRITLVGLNEWNAYENIEYDYLNNLNFTYASPTYQDHVSNASRNFQEQFKSEYKAAPSMYAYQGFDVTLYFASMLDRYGKDFLSCLENAPVHCGFNSCYRFRPFGKEDGYENTFVNILQMDDFELIRINKP